MSCAERKKFIKLRMVRGLSWKIIVNTHRKKSMKQKKLAILSFLLIFVIGYCYPKIYKKIMAIKNAVGRGKK